MIWMFYFKLELEKYYFILSSENPESSYEILFYFSNLVSCKALLISWNNYQVSCQASNFWLVSSIDLCKYILCAKYLCKLLFCHNSLIKLFNSRYVNWENEVTILQWQSYDCYGGINNYFKIRKPFNRLKCYISMY